MKVACALIYKEDRILLCRRPPNKAQGGLWEFPGGKLEKGETAEQALIREIREELDLSLSIEEPLPPFTWTYTQPTALTIELFPFWCTCDDGDVTLRDHVDYAWLTREQIGGLQLCEADRHLLKRLDESRLN